MAKLATAWIDNKNPVAISASGNPTILDEASAILLDETGASLLAESNTVTAKAPTSWS